MDSDGEIRNSSPEEKNPKRRMKTPFQLEALERVYAEDRYPTEAVRAELSLHLNLSDKQLQMWFCHRRLKDRKVKEDENPGSGSAGGGGTGGGAGRKKQKTERSVQTFEVCQTAAVLESEVGDNGGRNLYNEEFEEEEDYGYVMRPASAHRRKSAVHEEEFVVARKRNEMVVGRSVKSRMGAENVAVAAVESQLGEPVREDGPALGVEFDALPAGAFSTSVEHKPEQRVSTGAPQQRMQNEGRAAMERQEIRPSKAGGGFGLPPLPTATATTTGMKRKAVGGGQQNMGAQQHQHQQHVHQRASREFQFLPEQPMSREENNHRQIQLNLHPHSDRSYEMAPASRFRSLSPLGAFLPANMHLSSGDGYGFQHERVENVAISLLPPGDSRASGLYATNGLGLDEAHRRGLYQHRFEVEGQMGIPQSALQMIGASQPSVGFDSLALFQEQEQTRMEKKRKTEEMKIAKESEAHVKRMRRDLERQEMLRQKKEEQMRKELQKQDRDKRKEEERVLRERQREEERIQREQRREIERQEKMVEKENKRMEKQHRREEVRKAKEAARLKAATERAAAKKLSKESMDTIDDDQLELLESATSQGLFSISGLENGDADAMEISKVLLKSFPPASVRMKPPSAVYSWNGLEHTVGHLLMVWRFLTTFADVIGLWPFTLDEFVQALQDFDPRLLGEIHVCLIKMMVKNIEDAAQAAASGGGGSQNAVNLVSGGHAQIVEAAYEWGFNIREWGQFVSPLTWPDILRQFALAAGYGPKWKRSNKESPKPAVEAEEHPEEESAVTVLRTGAAAANAVALMQGKGVGHLRRCRYRLTPGTVKYAAFHVLSLEGTKGLTILEVAEKIQKSGLRDLTTSKTPEASIAAALSRDANLFERVAPSTYSVRPAFRKDAEDTEEVLQSARERIHLFQSGFLDVEEADKETDEVEELERDEDYDSDGQDVEDGSVGALLPKDSDVKDELQAEEEVVHVNSSAEEEMEIDESQVGESWVQGLMEGEYSALSMEERLMALVALVNVVNEGNAIRLALEARMEASSALKRQMWAEAQIDRRRHKEEQLSRQQLAPLPAPKNEGAGPPVAADLGSLAITGVDEKSTESAIRPKNETAPELNALPSESSPAPESLAMCEANLALQEKSLTMQEKDLLLQEGFLPRENAVAPCYLSEKSRAQVKVDIGVWAEELYVVRSLPLGLDRRRNRYWQFVTSSGGQDPSHGRIYYESSVDGHWEVIDTEEAFDALMTSLDIRGTREAALHAVLGRLERSIRQGMRTASPSRFSSGGYGSDTKLDTLEARTLSSSAEGGGASGLLYSAAVDGSPESGHRLEFLPRTGAIVVDLEKTVADKQSSFERFKDFEQWIWNENSKTLPASRVSKSGRKRESDLLLPCAKCHDLLWATDKHCQVCHLSHTKTPAKHDLHVRECEERRKKKDPAWRLWGPSTVVPPRIQVLKANILAIEMAVPLEAIKDVWDHQHRKAWASSVKAAVTPSELLQSLVELEGRVKRDWLSSTYDTNEEELSACTGSRLPVETRVAPWVPHTSAAVGLRMMAFDAALVYSSEQKKRQKQEEKEEEQQNSVRTSIGGSVSSPDSPTADDPSADEDDDTLRDVPVGRGRGRGKGGRKSRVNRGTKSVTAASAKVGGAKRGPRRKLQEESSAVATKDVQRAKVGGRGQGRGSRGRPRGHGAGRPRGRGSRGGHRNQVFVRGVEKVPKQKNPNELMAQEATLQRTPLEQSPVPEEEDLGVEPESEDDGFSKGEWELEDQLEDPQEMEDDENAGNIVEDDEDDEAHADEDDEGGQADEVDEEEEDRQSMDEIDGQRGEKDDDDLDEQVEVDSTEEEDEDLEDGADSER